MSQASSDGSNTLQSGYPYFHLIEKKAIRSSLVSRVERRPNGSLHIEMAIEFDEEARDSVSHSYSWHKTLARQSAVYEIVNRASGCRYVGSAADVKDRALTHERDLVNRRHHNHRLQSDFNVYGADGFSFIVARAVPVSDLLRVEDQTILLHRADGHALYNLTSDGQGAPRSYSSHPTQRAPVSAPPSPPDSRHMSPTTKVWLAIAVLLLLILFSR